MKVALAGRSCWVRGVHGELCRDAVCREASVVVSDAPGYQLVPTDVGPLHRRKLCLFTTPGKLSVVFNSCGGRAGSETEPQKVSGRMEPGEKTETG